MKTLVIFSHTYQAQSVSNVAIIEVFKQTPNFEVRNLEELYPDGKIDVQAEQEALESADFIVFQYPVFLFNVPPMLKRWLDEVWWLYGFAYGTSNEKLNGKKVIQSFTTGHGSDVFTPEICEVVYAPIRTITLFVGAEYLEPAPVFGLLPITNPDAAIRARVHAEKLVQRIQSLG